MNYLHIQRAIFKKNSAGSRAIKGAVLGLLAAVFFPGALPLSSLGGNSAVITAYAAPKQEANPQKEASVYTTVGYVCRIDGPEVTVYKSANIKAPAVKQARRGESFSILGYPAQGWILVETDAGKGYVKLSDGASVLETTVQTVDKSAAARNQVVEYALEFVGSRYVYGGNDPRTGVDCSGFTKYVMENGAGVRLNRSSGSQAAQGREVSPENRRPGDLIFYSSGGRINHVALYIGNDQVVHASTEKTGVKISNWDYRKPYKIVSVL